MPVSHQLAVGRQPLEGRVLEGRLVALDVVEDCGLEHEEPAVDPALADLRLLGKRAHEIALEVEPAEAGGRPDGSHRRELLVLAVEIEKAAEVDVRHAITVRHHERTVTHPRR